jgi:hypothetical protein
MQLLEFETAEHRHSEQVRNLEVEYRAQVAATERHA